MTHNDLSLPSGIKFIQALKNMPRLSKLSLNSCQLDSDLLLELATSLADNEVLTDLNLYSNDINSEGAKVIADLLKNKVNMKCLGLSNNYIGHGGAREIAAVCQESLFGLTRLSLESNLIGNIGCMGLSKALIDNETLEELYLYNNEIDDESMTVFTKMLANKKKLRVLGLEYNKIRHQAEMVFKVACTLPIERLLMSQNALQATIGESVYEFITTSKTLRELRINHNSAMGDEACKRIAQGLLKTGSLKVCHMSDTRMGNGAAMVMAEVIRRHESSIRDLDLSNNLIIMDDIEILANAFKDSVIECLNLRGNIVSAEEIVAFEHLLAPVCTMTKRKFMF